MRKLSLNILFLILVISAVGQVNPHGEALTMDCADCHTTQGWSYMATSRFDHDSTQYTLEGQHRYTDCTTCHTSLVFSDAKSNCIDCHDDLHNTTLGSDCANCHTPDSWIVENITELHQMSRFPLLGAHNTADCSSCHISASQLVFEPLGVECVDCHEQDYLATTSPNHIATGLSTDCIECHDIAAHEWIVSGDNHAFFPLIKGHAISDCSACHTDDLTEPLSSECYSCHQEDYMEAENHVLLGYPTECELCHTIDVWEQSIFDHNATNFPLTGAHVSSECLECHSDGYTGTPTECSACHTDNYNGAKDPDHTAAGISTECETCHSTRDWTPSTFDHTASTGFELSGGHAGRQCSDCHEGTTSGANSDCISCHQENYNEAKNHVALGYPTDCLLCHNTTDWGQSAFDHNATEFPLTGSHVATECTACHANGYPGTPTECSACHTNNYNDAQNPSHTAAGISTDCETCHGTGNWTPSTFDHNATTGFALTGGHAIQQCSECHPGSTSGASSECISCHQEDYNGAKDHVEQNYPTECILCHTTNDWGKSTFDHNATSFPLTGSHIATECVDCHENGYAGTPTECNACHTNDYNDATDPDHKTAGISTDCETCHSTTAWAPSSFNHNSTGFPLTGGHRNRQCSDCHIGTTSGASSECISCHRTDYNEAKEHVSQSYSHDCLQCHNTSDWDQIAFNHNATNFPLTGSHKSTDCAECHESGYAGTPTDCKACHTTDYNDASDPKHVEAGISKDCESCHSTTAWTPSSFDHTASTGFPLTAGHDLQQCSDCHKGTTSGASSDCYSCHQSDYNGAEDHLSQNYSHDCLLCHNTTDWEQLTFDHNSTNFPLTGAHIATECTACHTAGYPGTPTECSACHTGDYNNANNPSHTAAGISTNCETCHTTSNWSPSTFDHNASTGFPLTAGHNLQQCSECHVGTTSGASSDCISCHQTNYTQAKDHVAQNYPFDCLLCHNTANWSPSTFDHNATGFPLTGLHATTECIACHSQGYVGTTTKCSDCHQADYNGTTNPNHSELGYSLECDDCHGTGPGWDVTQASGLRVSSFSHDAYYVLQGAHAAIADDCYLCHDGDYNNTPSTCYECHKHDYDKAKKPKHESADFSTDCELCHTETAWEPATFDHDNQYFPIYSGTHKGEWDNCTDCHEESSSYSIYTCTSCHEHSFALMLIKHRKVKDYAYASASCLACHPNGKVVK